jgi:hypothetical protein
MKGRIASRMGSMDITAEYVTRVPPFIIEKTDRLLGY